MAWGFVDSQVDGPVEITLGIPADALLRLGITIPSNQVAFLSSATCVQMRCARFPALHRHTHAGKFGCMDVVVARLHSCA